MSKRPNVLWLMSDQHNASCAGYAGNPDVRTPNLDRIAGGGVEFVNGFANNPICSPSRICFMTGQYMHTHRMFGNNHADYQRGNPDTFACLFRRYGYQTGLFGKSHMVRRWDEEGFESVRYTDLCDATYSDPKTTHYFKRLCELGLSDSYEEGTPKPGQDYMNDGAGPSTLPYEHSIERFTGDATLEFLKGRDEERPFFVHMSFQRPHAPIAPAKEFFEMYDPEKLTLPASSVDWLERRFAGKPSQLRDVLLRGCNYPLASDEKTLRRCLASYYGLISAIDREIGRVLDFLEKRGELENTIVFYTADHGDFAGEHGLFHKNFGLYESIQKIPFLLKWPGGPKGVKCESIVESVDLYPSLCELCGVPVPAGREGVSLLKAASGESPKEAAYCEWENFGPVPAKLSSIRTRDFRLVFYSDSLDGELYDRRRDPGEIDNLWDSQDYAAVKASLLSQLLSFTMKYQTETGVVFDRELYFKERNCPTQLVHKNRVYWSDFERLCSTPGKWPPSDMRSGNV